MEKMKSSRSQTFAFVYALVALFIASAPGFSAVDKSTSTFWQSQFTDLSGQIVVRGSLRKTAALADRKVLDTNALIWDTDRDPTDVVLRRTEAMLAELSKSKGKSKRSAFAARLVSLKQAHAARYEQPPSCSPKAP